MVASAVVATFACSSTPSTSPDAPTSVVTDAAAPPSSPARDAAVIDSAPAEDAGPPCNDLENTATVAAIKQSTPGTPGAPSDGVVVDGTYELTTIYYDVLPKTDPLPERQTLRVTNDGIAFEIVSQRGTDPEERTNVIAQLAAAQATYCPPTPLWPLAKLKDYTAGQTRIVFFPKSGQPYAYEFRKR